MVISYIFWLQCLPLSRVSLDLSSYYNIVPCFSNHSSGCKTRMSTSAAVCENSQCGLFGTTAPMEYSFDFRVSLADHTDSIHSVRLSDRPAETFLNCSVRVMCGCFSLGPSTFVNKLITLIYTDSRPHSSWL